MQMADTVTSCTEREALSATATPGVIRLYLPALVSQHNLDGYDADNAADADADADLNFLWYCVLQCMLH